MLDLLLIKKRSAWVIENLKKRGFATAEAYVEEILLLQKKRSQQQQIMDKEKHLLNQWSRNFKKLDSHQQQQKKKKIQELKEKYNFHYQEFKKLTDGLKEKLLLLPNLPLSSTPVGLDKKENVVVKSVGIPKRVGSPHWELLKQYQLVDFEKGNKLTGAGFPVYTNRGAKILRGLINFFLDQAAEAGYQEVYPPLLVNKESATGTGQLPDKEGVMYKVEAQDLYLIPTAEVPITNLHAKELFKMDQLPIHYVAHTPCFRTESFSWGAGVRGLNRLKQFNKIELVEIHTQEQSEEGLAKMLSYACNLLNKLGITYRIVELCTGDLGQAAAKTYDLEAWAPGQGKWLEISSISHFGSYQTRRMQILYRDKEGRKKYCHTLNGSAFGLPRLLAALLETYQQTSCINLPDSLEAYIGEKKINLPRKKE